MYLCFCIDGDYSEFQEGIVSLYREFYTIFYMLLLHFLSFMIQTLTIRFQEFGSMDERTFSSFFLEES